MSSSLSPKLTEPTDTRIPHLLKVGQAAAWLNVSRTTLYTLPIRYVKIRGARRYDPKDLQLYADLHGNRPPLRRPA